jgi:nucleotidyltransferase/DNA polymerase involved in DNA repair
MPAVTAHRLCPQGIYLPPRIDYYAEVSGQIRDIFERFTPLVEPLSLDEAFLDVTGSEHLFGPAVEIGRKIKQAIREELRLVASVGVAPNKFLAKIASDLKKPDALVVVEPDKVQEFLDPLPVERLWGVGKQSSKVFQRLGIRTIGQLRQWPLDVLQARFGSSGEHLWNLAHGRDDRPVVPEREAKSISHETTFEHDIADMDVLRAWLVDLTEQVGCRLRRHGLRGRTVQLKVRFADFSLITRSRPAGAHGHHRRVVAGGRRPALPAAPGRPPAGAADWAWASAAWTTRAGPGHALRPGGTAEAEPGGRRGRPDQGAVWRNCPCPSHHKPDAGSERSDAKTMPGFFGKPSRIDYEGHQEFGAPDNHKPRTTTSPYRPIRPTRRWRVSGPRCGN